jgi:dihydrofolate reductase
MKTQYYTATSLDGFIADANHALEWLFQFENTTSDRYSQFMSQVGAIAMGSSTYEWILEHEIYPNSESPQPWMYEQPTWVFSARELPTIDNANINFVKGDVQPVYEAMKAAANEKNIWIVGGGDLVGQFYDRGLLDEIIVQITSVTLGSGAPLLPRAIVNPPLKLISATALGSAFAELRYEVYRWEPPIS